MRLLLALLPLVAFYLAESWWGLRPAVAVGVGLALVEVGYTRWAEGRWNRLTLGTAALVAGLGGLALLSDDPRFVLWSPVIGDVVIAGVLVTFLARGANPIAAAAEAQDPDLDLHPLEARFLEGIGWRFAGLLGVHAALTAWSVDQPRETWLFVSGPVQYVLMGLQLAGEMAYGRLVVLPRVDAAISEATSDDPPGPSPERRPPPPTGGRPS